MTLRVLEPGLCSLLVDHGRPAARSLGVPVGGAADRTALAIGNALVGNPADAPALEITLAGPTLRAERPVGCVVFGAPFELKSGLRSLAAGKTFTLGAGDVLRIGGTPFGMRAYLCVPGGFQGPTILASRSALEPVRAGDELVCDSSTVSIRSIRRTFPTAEGPVTLRVTPGAQAGWFSWSEFEGPGFTVSPSSNRMGLRLRGEPLTLPQREMVSEPVCPGTVQVTRDGQCIILGIDGQTIGGYPKIAHVIQADLDRLGQLRPGESVRFRKVSMEQATALRRQQQVDLRADLVRWRTAEVFSS